MEATVTLIGDPSSLIAAYQKSAQAGASFQQSITQQSSSIESATGAQRNYATTLNSSGRAAMDNASSNSSLNGILNSSGQIVTKAASSQDALGSSLAQSAASAQKASTTQRGFGQSLSQSVGFMTTAVGVGTGLAASILQLDNATLGVAKADTMHDRAVKTVLTSQTALQALIDKGVTSGPKYEAAVQAVAIAKEREANSSETLRQRQEDLSLTQTQFYTSILPGVVSAVGLVISKYSEFQSSISGLGSKLSGFTSALGLTNSQFLLIAGPIAAVAIALTLIGTNAFGARDKLNAFGKALGDAVPFLQPLLIGIKQIGQAIGLTGNDAKQGGDQMQAAFSGIEQSINSMAASSDKATSDFGKALQTQAQDVKTFATDSSNSLSTLSSDWGTFVTAFQKGDIEASLDAIGKLFIDLGAAAVQGFKDVSKAYGDNFNMMVTAAKKVATDLQPIFDKILAIAQASAGRVGLVFAQGLGSIADQVTAWFNENVTGPIMQAGEALNKTTWSFDLVDVIWQAIKTASTPIADAAAWVNTNIISPINDELTNIDAQLGVSVAFGDLVAKIWEAIKAASNAITDAQDWFNINITQPIMDAGESLNQQTWSFDLVKVIWDAIIAASKILGVDAAGAWLNDNIATPIANALNKIGDAFKGGVGDLGKIIWDAIIANSKPITDVSKFVYDKFVGPILDALKEKFGPIGEAIAKGLEPANKAYQDFAKNGDLARQSLEGVDTAAKTNVSTLQGLTSTYQQIGTTVEETGGYFQVATAATQQHTQAANTNAAAVSKEQEAVTKNLTTLRIMIPTYAQAMDSVAQFSAASEENRQKMEPLVALWSTMGAKLTELKTKNDEMGASLRAHNLLMQESVYVDGLKTKGMLEQMTALANTQEETVVLTSKVAELNDELSKGTIQAATYANSFQKAELEFANSTVKISVLWGEIESLNTHLENGTAQVQAYQTGFAEGVKEFDNWITSTIQASAKQEEFNTLLQGAADVWGGFPSMLEPSTASLQAFVKAGMSMSGMLQDGGKAMEEFKTLVQKSFDEMTSAGQEFFNKLVEASGKGGTDALKGWQDAFAQLPNAVAQTLDESEREALVGAAQIAQAGKQAGEAFALNIMAGQAAHKPWDQTVTEAKQAVMDIISQTGAMAPDMAAKIDEFFARLDTAPAEKIPGLIAEFAKIPGPIGEIFSKMAASYAEKAGTPIEQGANTTATNTITALTSIQTAAQTFGQIATMFQAQIEQTLPRMAGIAATGVATAFGTMASQSAPAFGQIGTLAQQIFNGLATIASTSLAGVVEAFNTLAGQVAPAFGNIGTIAQQIFDSITTIATDAGTAISDAMFTAQEDGSTAFETLQSDAEAALQAANDAAVTAGEGISDAIFTAQEDASTAVETIQSDAESAFDAVGSAGEDAGSRVADAMSEIEDSAASATDQVNELASAIDSLHDKTITITVDITGPGTAYLAKGGIVSKGKSKGRAFITKGMQAYRGAVIGEGGPELVLPLATGGLLGRLKKSSEQADLVSALNLGPLGGKKEKGNGNGGPIKVSGEITESAPIIINLDGQVLTRAVQRRLLEFQDAMV